MGKVATHTLELCINLYGNKQILILEEQSDQGLYCLLFHLHVFDKIP